MPEKELNIYQLVENVWTGKSSYRQPIKAVKESLERREKHTMIYLSTFDRNGPVIVSLSTSRKVVILLTLILVAAVLFAIFVTPLHTLVLPQSPPQPPSSPPPSFFASIDTMKESQDTETHPLSWQEITNIVNLSASLNTNYITVDTHWDYPDYMQEWINAVRATGRHVWFRIHPNQWEDSNGTTGIMTPSQYEASERAFILSHPTFFLAGDILDPCSEPENSMYWDTTFGHNWSVNAPNEATKEFNAFLRDTTDIADSALHQMKIYGVITTIHSVDPFIPTHPNVLERATVNKFGYITIDSYPDKYTTDPAVATDAHVSELKTIEDIWHIPIVIGEIGYSNNINVDDDTQKAVLKAELDGIAPLQYIAGMNYWVGPGTEQSGGYTHIFAKSGTTWSLRPAALELSMFYKNKLSGNQRKIGARVAYASNNNKANS